MNDAIGIFFVLSALVGFIFFSVVSATVFLFLLGFWGVTIKYLLSKLPNPASRSPVFFKACKQGNERSDKADYASQIKEYIQSFKKGCCHLKIIKGRTIYSERSNSQFTDDSKKDATNLPDGNFQDVVNPPVENISNHSATKVSQEEKACQPKVNDTLTSSLNSHSA